jgi:CRP-like cAMP-binding protein
MIASRFGEEQRNGDIMVPITETEIASTAGLSRETVSREIGKLKQASVLGVAQNRLVIYNIQALHDVVSAS